MYFLDICEKSGFLSAILFAKSIINIIKILVPVILIIMCAIDLTKQVLNTEAKSYEKIVKRMIAACAIFFVPTLVGLLLSLQNIKNYTLNSCWINANSGTINILHAQEKAEKRALEDAKQKEKEKAKKNREKVEKSREEIRKKKEKLAEEAKKNNNSNSGSNNNSSANDTTLYKENGTDGMITVVDGVFYKPATGTSGADGTKGSGPYGYVIFFYNRLKTFTDAAAQAGYTINMSTSQYGAWRPLSQQQYYYNCYLTKACNNGNLAARPGTSNHGWGIASDLSFGNNSALYWAHDNASKYGLKFPLCQNVRTGNCVENWHIEPADLRTK